MQQKDRIKKQGDRRTKKEQSEYIEVQDIFSQDYSNAPTMAQPDIAKPSEPATGTESSVAKKKGPNPYRKEVATMRNSDPTLSQEDAWKKVHENEAKRLELKGLSPEEAQKKASHNIENPFSPEVQNNAKAISVELKSIRIHGHIDSKQINDDMLRDHVNKIRHSLTQVTPQGPALPLTDTQREAIKQAQADAQAVKSAKEKQSPSRSL